MATKLKTYLPLKIVAYQGQHELVQSAFEAAGLEDLVDRAMYWMHLLAARSNDYWREDAGIPVSVNAELSCLLLGRSRGFALMVKALLGSGIIETDGYFRPGSQSRKFRIAPAITQRPNELYEIKGRLAETIRKAEAKIRAKWHRGVLDALKTPRFVFDSILSVHRKITISPQARIDLDADATEAERQRRTIDYSYWFTLDSLERMGSMDDGELLTECDYSRLHSPVSRAWSGFRRYMTLDGEPLASCDIKNSQPFLLGVLFEKLADMFEKASEMPSEVQGKDYLSTSLTEYLDMLVAPTDVRVAVVGYMMKRFTAIRPGEAFNLRHDLSVFGELAKNGGLYEHIMDLSGFKGTRSSFKKEFFTAFYGKPAIAQHLPTWKKFQQAFPDLAREIDLAKAEDYTVLPVLMQMIEARYMFHHVAKRLLERGVTFVTLHDSVMAPSSEITEVQKIMKQVLAECGMHPTLAVEDKQEKRVPRSRPLEFSQKKVKTHRKEAQKKVHVQQADEAILSWEDEELGWAYSRHDEIIT